MIEEILKHRIRRCAVVGTAKNVGKTTALNHLASCAAETGLRPGLVSFGRDGESVDALTGDPKPPVLVPPGAVFATIESLVSGGIPNESANEGRQDGSEVVSAISGTGISTALGEVGVFRNGLTETRMELMGVNRVSTLLEIQRRMRSFCDVIFVDGALDRRSPAMPLIADGAFLATGAALDGNLDSLVGATVDSVRQLNLETDETGLADEQESVLESGIPLVLGRADEPQVWRSGTGRLSLTGKNLPEWNEGENLVLAGALTETIAASLLDRCRTGFTGTLTARDATAVFLSDTTHRRLAAAGIRLRVLHGIRLLGIIVNPWTPYGEAMNPPALVAELGQALEGAGFPLPIWDLVAGVTRRP